MSIDLIITRHAQKQKSAVPTPDEDIDLIPEGKKAAFENGKKHLSGNYNLIHVITSHYLRTQNNYKEMLKGAGYDPNDDSKVIVVKRPEISIGCGVDWRAPEVPSWDKLPEDECIRIMLTEFYTPRAGRPDLPSTAGYAYSILDSVITGIDKHMENQSKHGLVVVSTHATLIDSFGGIMAGYLDIDPTGNVSLIDYPGAFKMGEVITGRIPSLTGDPLLSLDIKGKQFTHPLSELKNMREFHKSFSQYATK